MIIKKLAVTAAAGAIMLSSAAGVFAWGGSHTYTSHSYNSYTKNVTVTKTEVNNEANVNNTVYTVSNTGLNFTGANGGNNTANTTSGEAEKGGTTGDTNGAAYLGGASNTVVTGNAGASSMVANVVNTTVVHQ